MIVKILSILPVCVCLAWVMLLLSAKKQNLPKRYLAFFLMISIVNYSIHVLFFNHQYRLFGLMNNLWLFTSLLGYPLYYYYIRLQTCDLRIDLRWSWFVLPAALVSILSFILYFSMSSEEVDLFVCGMLYHKMEEPEILPPLLKWQKWCYHVLFKIVFIAEVILSVFFSFRCISRYNREISDFYSDIEGKNLSPMKWILCAFLFASFISVLSAAIGKEFFIDKGLFLAVPSVTHSAFLFLLGWVGYRQNFTVADFRKEQEEYHATECVTGRRRSQILTIEFLENYIQTNNLYQNPTLRIIDVAELLHTNRTYISRLVNEHRHENFCEWINGFRIDYAGKILENEAESSRLIQSVAIESGFSNTSSFYRAFKERKKMSPKQYKERNRHIGTASK